MPTLSFAKVLLPISSALGGWAHDSVTPRRQTYGIATISRPLTVIRLRGVTRYSSGRRNRLYRAGV